MLGKLKGLFLSKEQINPSFEYKGLVKYIPLIICGGFYFLTILLFEFGPYDWKVNNKLELYLFLTMALVALILGYIMSIKKSEKDKFNYNSEKIIRFNIDNIVLVSFVFFIISTIANLYVTTGKLYPDVVLGIKNAALAYKISHSTLSPFATIIYYINIFLSLFTMFLIPLAFIYFKNLSKKSKIMVVIAILLNLSCGVAQGIINGCATFVFEIILYCIIYICSTLKNGKKLDKIGLLIFTILLVIFFFAYYKSTMSSRLVSDVVGKPVSAKGSKMSKEEIQDIMGSAGTFAISELKDKYILSFLPDSIEGSVNHAISYVSHGYKGLSLAMTKGFTSSFGLGFSDFLRHNILKVLFLSEYEDPIYERTYMHKIEEHNWVTGKVWSTFFIFPASDIGFVLTIPFIFLIGYIFGLSWKHAIKNKNIFAAIVLFNMCMTVCFFSANNNIYQNPSVVSAVLAIIMWFVLDKINKKRVMKDENTMVS